MKLWSKTLWMLMTFKFKPNPYLMERGPDSYSPTDKQAMSGSDSEKWVASTSLGCKSLELQNLDRLGTFEVVDHLPKGKRALGFKWVHKVKMENGRPIKYKSRLTVMGCHQRAGIDFSETFSPVARLSALRLIIALGVTENFHYHQLDVGNAFPNADVEEEIYLHEGSSRDGLTSGQVPSPPQGTLRSQASLAPMASDGLPVPLVPRLQSAPHRLLHFHQKRRRQCHDRGPLRG
jgi:hypothetical protein